MSLTVSESQNVATLISYLAGIGLPGGTPASATAATKALVDLAQRAHKTLGAGPYADEAERAIAALEGLRACAAAMRPVVEYVSAGRRYVDVEPYPDGAARAALGLVTNGGR